MVESAPVLPLLEEGQRESMKGGGGAAAAAAAGGGGGARRSRVPLHKLAINDNFTLYGNYHGNKTP